MYLLFESRFAIVSVRDVPFDIGSPSCSCFDVQTIAADGSKGHRGSVLCLFRGAHWTVADYLCCC